MNPIRIVELFANIKKTFVSFFSIFMFVALGVGIYLGIRWVSPGLQTAADRAFDEGAYHNVQVQFPYGLSDDDLSKLEAVEGVSEVEAVRHSFQTAVYDDQKKTVLVGTVGERIDTLTVVEGELPSKKDEIAVYEACAKKYGIAVGDKMTFQKDASEKDAASKNSANTDSDGMQYLTGSTFTVTALVTSPEYIATASDMFGVSTTASGSIDLLGWVTPEAFDGSAFLDAYPVVNVRCNDLDGLASYGEAYREAATPIQRRIAKLGDELADARYSSLHDEAQKRLDEGEKKLAEGKKRVSDGEKQLADGREELETKRAEGEAKLADAYNQLIYYEGLRDEAEGRIASARSAVSQAESALAVFDGAKSAVESRVSDAAAYKADLDAKLASGEITQEEYEAALDSQGASVAAELQPYASQLGVTIPAITHENYSEALSTAQGLVANIENVPVTFNGETITVAQGRVRLNEARSQLQSGMYQYNQLVSRLESGWSEYYAGKEQLATEVAAAEERIAEGERQLEDAKKQVTEGERQLKEAKEQVAALEPYAWSVTGRLDNVGAANVSVFATALSNLSMTMALLFVVVGLLVTYSAISRIVNDQITQIGAKKALGMRLGEVSSLYLLYAGIAVLAGVVTGIAMGVFGVEHIIAQALGTGFTFGTFPPYFDPALAALITLLELAMVLGATWLACSAILRRNAVDLLRGEEPPSGKARFFENWGVWRRMPLFSQVVVNNCINDKRRVFSTVVGVVGCTALIVTAITLNNDVMNSYNLQYSNVYGFSAIAYADPAVTGATDKVEAVFAKDGETSAQAVRKTMLLALPNNGGSSAVNVIVPANEEAFAQVYHVNPVSGGEVDLSGEGVWVTQAYQEHFGAQVGDKLIVDVGDGKKHELPILGFYEFYLTYFEVIMGPAYYEREFEVKATPNVVFANSQDVFANGRLDELKAIEGFETLADDKQGQYGNFETFSSVSSAVVAIYLVLSALMAFVVLLNLNIMCVDEKKRELIVLMICGYSAKDAKRYVYLDTIVLTAIGIALGVVVGNIMGSVTIAAMEPDTASFLKDVDPMAVGVGVAGSAILATIMCVISLRRIPRFDLTDINRF